MPARPAFRMARAVVFATVCVLLATAGHVTASRATVPPLAVAAGLAGLTALAGALTGAERSLPTILGLLLGGQFMLHALFAAAQHGQQAHGALGTPHASGGAAMTAAHVLAAGVSAWWLRRGERSMWELARKIATAAVRPARALLAAPVLLSPPTLSGAVTWPPPRPRGTLLRHVVVRRGPPSPSTVLG